MMHIGECMTTQKAKGEYKCDGCGNDIVAGQSYDRFAIPPWLDAEPDVDDEGKTVYHLRPKDERRWQVNRFHMECNPYFYF